MKAAIDRFSNQSDSYKKFRPIYPEELFEFLYAQCRGFHSAWDCATGNGQVAAHLASKFTQVKATDISQKQLDNAQIASNIEYSLCRAEQTAFPNSSFDLITVGQAIHWFDIPKFFDEVRRVLKPEGLLAFWGYGLIRVNPEINKIIDHFYSEIVGPYWDFERKHVESSYETIDFNWKEVETPHNLAIKAYWDIKHFEGYFNSWSAVQKYKDQHNGENPVTQLMKNVSPLWDKQVLVQFPIFIRASLK